MKVKNLHTLIAAVLVTIHAREMMSQDEGDRTLIHLSNSQLFEFDETGMITLSNDQKAMVENRVGFAPTRVRPVYDAPDGESSSGYNLALRIDDMSVAVLHQFLIEDSKLKEIMGKIPREESGAAITVNREAGYVSYLVDSKGRVWQHVSNSEYTKQLKKPKESPAYVYIYFPSHFNMTETVATRDTIRKILKVLKEGNIGHYKITDP